MKTFSVTCGLLVALVAACRGEIAPSAPASKTDKARAASKIVVDVLRQEAREAVEDRTELLKPALDQAPNNDAARWQSGFVFEARRKEWLRYDEVPEAVKSDDSLAAYWARRAKYPETAAG